MIPGDSLRAVLDSVFAAPAYRWQERPDPWRWLREWAERLTDWLIALRSEHPGGFKLVIAAAGVLFAAVLAHAGFILWQTVRRAAAAEVAAPGAEADTRDADWHFRQADEAARGGLYREALRLVFAGVVLRLDALGTLERMAGKTPAEYAREARLAGDDRERLRDLVGALYRHVYGGVPCGPDDYARWRSAARGAWHEAAG